MEALSIYFDTVKKMRFILMKQENTNWIFHDPPANEYVSFLVTINNQKISVAFSMATNGIIETMKVLEDGQFDNDSISHHESMYELIEYLKGL